MGWISEAFHSVTGKGSNQGAGTQQSGASTLLQAALGIGASYLDYALDYRNSRKEATKAYERNIAAAKMQNEYNSPVNAMQRLRDAGLNPNLIYGSVNNNAASISSAPVANPPSAKFNPVHDYMNLMQQDAMTQQIKAQTDLTKQQEMVSANQRDMQTYQTAILDSQRKLAGYNLKAAEMRDRIMQKEWPVIERHLDHDAGDWSNYWRGFGEMIKAFSPFASTVGDYISMSDRK